MCMHACLVKEQVSAGVNMSVHVCGYDVCMRLYVSGQITKRHFVRCADRAQNCLSELKINSVNNLTKNEIKSIRKWKGI